MSTSDFRDRRVQRRLEDLERTNPTDIPASSFIPLPSQSQQQSHLYPSSHPLIPGHRTGSNPPTPTDAAGTPPGSAGPGGSGTTAVAGGVGGQTKVDARKKQSGNVRKIVLAKKSLRDWLEELPSSPTPPYITASAPPPSTPARKICASCGYLGVYACPRCGEWSCDRDCVEVHARDGGCGVGM